MDEKTPHESLATITLDATIKDNTRPVTSSRVWLEVRDVMSTDVATISPEECVAAASIIMSERHNSCIVAVDRGVVVGILTETDLLKKVATEGKALYEMSVATVMSASVECVPEHVSVLVASRLMQAKGIKRLPVLTDSRLIGIVTQTDLTRTLAHYGTWRDVAEIMNPNVARLNRQASVAQAAGTMSSGNVCSVVAMEGDEPVGVLTQRDFLTKIIAPGKDPLHTRIEEVMSSPPRTVPPSYSIHSACRTMEELRIRRLLVMDGGKLLGVVTQSDIFAAIKNKLQEEEEKNLELLEQSLSCTFTTDLEGRITYVNPAFVGLFELSGPEELLNEPFLSERFWVDPNLRSLYMGAYTNWRFDKSELSLKSAKGKKLYASVFSAFTTDAHGVINGRQGIVYDLTERIEAARKQDELIRYLKQSNQELETIAHMVSDDLKSPLRDILSQTDAIMADLRESRPEEGMAQLGLLRKRVNGLYQMLNDLLNHCQVRGFASCPDGPPLD